VTVFREIVVFGLPSSPDWVPPLATFSTTSRPLVTVPKIV
jgi:hypothetical protein